jgi:hypothetical protein
MTDEFNYRAYVQNANAIRKLSDFDNPKEIIEYFCKYGHMNESDFVIADKQFWYEVVAKHLAENYSDRLDDEAIEDATEDIVGRCFCYGVPTLAELPEYIADYMNR